MAPPFWPPFGLLLSSNQIRYAADRCGRGAREPQGTLGSVCRTPGDGSGFLTMADISWSAYALAMFTPEQRAAAVQAIPEDPPGLPPKPPVVPVTPPVGTQLGLKVGFDLPAMMARTGLNPNVPAELAQLTAAGWHFEGGLWFNGGLSASGVQGGTPNAVPAGPVAFVSATAIPSGSVLGYTVPVAPAVPAEMNLAIRAASVAFSYALRSSAIISSMNAGDERSTSSNDTRCNPENFSTVTVS